MKFRKVLDPLESNSNIFSRAINWIGAYSYIVYVSDQSIIVKDGTTEIEWNGKNA